MFHDEIYIAENPGSGIIQYDFTMNGVSPFAGIILSR